MTSARRTAAIALAAFAAAFAAATPASAAAGHGVAGYVADADTGLPVGGATVTWSGTTSPPPQAVTDGSGRYLFAGLDAGSAGTLSVTGPAGWDRLDVAGLVIPDQGTAAQNVQLHRDWATTAGGARASADDESVAGAGCGSAAAVDGDRGTGWSASATRPAGPPTLIVELPQTIDVRTFVIDPSSACGHTAGAALGRYRVETSADALTWATAAEGTLGQGDRGTAVEIAPAANAAAVRFVRLIAVAPQDSAATTVDLRELKVFGVGPNVAPTGTLAVEAPRNYVGGIVRLRASFTDPDSAILRYLWDFDGDGTWDQQTNGPSVAHVWQGAGTYHVAVGVRDFRGDLGTSGLDLRIIDPNVPLEAIPQRKPLITFDPPDGIDLAARIACSSKCRFTARLVMTQRTARALHTKRRLVLTLKRSTQGPGLGSWTLELPSRFVKQLRKAHLKRVTLRLAANAADQQGRRSAVSRWVTFS